MFLRARASATACTVPGPASRLTMRRPGKRSHALCAGTYSGPKNCGAVNTALRSAQPRPAREENHVRSVFGGLPASSVPGPRKHPRTGKFETNCHAKVWRLESPEGEMVEARNLKLYMTTRFGDDEGKRIYSLLSCAAGRFRKSGRGTGAGWRILEAPSVPE